MTCGAASTSDDIVSRELDKLYDLAAQRSGRNLLASKADVPSPLSSTVSHVEKQRDNDTLDSTDPVRTAQCQTKYTLCLKKMHQL